MPGLHRYYGAGHLHYITTSCFHRRAWFASEANRDLFVEVLEQVRRRYHFVVVGYVVMPEHVHLLLSEPERSNPSVVIQAIKQGFARRLLGLLRANRDPSQSDLWNQSLNAQHVWQRRFYDFVVRTYEKRQEKLRYIHQNPVRASLVLEPWHWRWSSAPHYLRGESGPVLVNELVMAEIEDTAGGLKAAKTTQKHSHYPEFSRWNRIMPRCWFGKTPQRVNVHGLEGHEESL